MSVLLVLMTLMYCGESELYSDAAGRGVVPEVSSTTVETTVVTRTAKTPPKELDRPREEEPSGPRNFVGNINTHKFHRASCRYASCTNCKAWFATRKEAADAGFDPCGICDP